MPVTGEAIFSTAGAIAHPVNMLDKHGRGNRGEGKWGQRAHPTLSLGGRRSPNFEAM